MPNLGSAEQEYRAEAERLALLTTQTQLDLIGMYRHTSGNPKLSKADRASAAARADALARLLGFTSGGTPSNPSTSSGQASV